MTIGIVIPEDSAQPVRLAEFNGIESYWATLGGYVERVEIDGSSNLLVDEDGKARARTFNRRATLHWWLHVPSAINHDHIVGPAILVGANRAGSFEDAPANLVEDMIGELRFTAWIRRNRQWAAISSFDDYFQAVEMALAVASEQGTDVRVRRQP